MNVHESILNSMKYEFWTMIMNTNTLTIIINLKHLFIRIDPFHVVNIFVFDYFLLYFIITLALY